MPCAQTRSTQQRSLRVVGVLNKRLRVALYCEALRAASSGGLVNGNRVCNYNFVHYPTAGVVLSQSHKQGCGDTYSSVVRSAWRRLERQTLAGDLGHAACCCVVNPWDLTTLRGGAVSHPTQVLLETSVDRGRLCPHAVVYTWLEPDLMEPPLVLIAPPHSFIIEFAGTTCSTVFR